MSEHDFYDPEPERDEQLTAEEEEMRERALGLRGPSYGQLVDWADRMRKREKGE